MWLLVVIATILFYAMYMYLDGLKTCKCVNPVYANRLKQVEGLFLGLNIVNLIVMTLGSFNLLSFLKSYKQYLMKFIMAGGVAMVIVYIYFLFNTYGFISTMGPNCACADGWQKYYLYIQGFLYLMALITATLGAGYVAFYDRSKLATIPAMIKKYVNKTEGAINSTASKVKRRTMSLGRK